MTNRPDASEEPNEDSAKRQPAAGDDAGHRTPALAVRRAVAPARAEASLFRPEVLAARQTQYHGTVMLAPRASFRLFTIVAIVAAAAIVGWLVYGEFTRTARINGWLLPQQGMVRVHAPRPGLVEAVYVSEGQAVRKGDRLLALSDDLQSARLGATQEQITRRLGERRASLAEERKGQQRLLAQQEQALTSRLAALRTDEQQIEREIGLLRQRVEIAVRAETLHREQHASGYISEMKLQQVQSELLEQQARLEVAERNRLAAQRERAKVEAERADLPLKFEREVAQLDRSISQLEQERAEAEARREIVVAAPQDGTVTAINAVVGTKADAGAPMLSIVPPTLRLEAHLYGPSRAIGFVRPGQRVKLRYQAYPYQSFGHYEGIVASVSRAPLSPADLPAQLAAMPGLTGMAAGAAAEPVYRITVDLASQSVTAYGAEVALQPGMTLEADVALERRRLFQWLLDPLYALKGRHSG